MFHRSTHDALVAIDVRRTPRADRRISRLFRKLDRNHTGNLEGDILDRFLEDITDYVMLEYERQGAPQNREELRTWIADAIDPNHDHRVSKADLRGGLKNVLDENETGRQPAPLYKRKIVVQIKEL